MCIMVDVLLVSSSAVSFKKETGSEEEVQSIVLLLVSSVFLFLFLFKICFPSLFGQEQVVWL